MTEALVVPEGLDVCCAADHGQRAVGGHVQVNAQDIGATVDQDALLELGLTILAVCCDPVSGVVVIKERQRHALVDKMEWHWWWCFC